MTQNSIKEGFERLRKDRELRPLADAALCRSESDWLIGINGTRAMTAFNSKEGGFLQDDCRRVQTPTLAILVEREDRIRGFKARDYWEVHAIFCRSAGRDAGRCSTKASEGKRRCRGKTREIVGRETGGRHRRKCWENRALPPGRQNPLRSFLPFSMI